LLVPRDSQNESSSTPLQDPEIHSQKKIRGHASRRVRGRRGTHSSRGRGSRSEVRSQVPAGKLSFSIITETGFSSTNSYPALQIIECNESESQLIVPHNFQNESSTTPQQGPEVHSQETIRMDHRERSGIGRATIINRGTSNSNGSSDAVRSHVQCK
jgi:hypothetical protein